MKIFNIEVSEQLIVSLLAYLMICLLLLHFKPSVMFTRDGQFKKFGSGNIKTNTVFPYWFVCTLFGLSVYFLYTKFYV